MGCLYTIAAYSGSRSQNLAHSWKQFFGNDFWRLFVGFFGLLGHSWGRLFLSGAEFLGQNGGRLAWRAPLPYKPRDFERRRPAVFRDRGPESKRSIHEP